MDNERVIAILAIHQRVSSGFTSDSPDGCRCGSAIHPDRIDRDIPIGKAEEISVRRDRALARHQANALRLAGL